MANLASIPVDPIGESHLWREWLFNLGEKAVTLNNGIIEIPQYTTSAAPAYKLGGMYFDTTLNKLRVGGATAWETVTSV